MWPSSASPWLGTFVKTQHDSLVECGIDCTVVNIRARRSGGNNLNYILSFFQIFFHSLFTRYEFLHVHHWLCWMLCLPIFWKRKIYTVHEGEFFVGGVRKFFINQAIKYCDGVIFVNRSMYQTYKRKYPSKSISFIPCGIDTSAFKPQNKIQSKLKLSLDINNKYLTFPASPKRQSKNAKLLRQWDEDYNQGNYEILWGGSIPYEKMALYMNASEAILTLGEYESDGMVVKESLACGIPVISTNVGNSNFYLSNPSSGAVIKPTLEELDNAIERIANLSHVGPQLAPEFEIKNVALKIVSFYQEVKNSHV